MPQFTYPALKTSRTKLAADHTKRSSAMADPVLTIVICFDHASITGGQAKVAFDSAVGLKRQGHRPIVFAAAGPISPQLVEAGIETICLDQKDLVGNPSKAAAAVQGVWNAAAATALGDLLETLPRENTIVHVHGWAKALSPAIAGPIRRSGLPAIYTIHEYFQFCPNGGFYNYQKHEICTLKPMSAALLVDELRFAHLSAKNLAQHPAIDSAAHRPSARDVSRLYRNLRFPKLDRHALPAEGGGAAPRLQSGLGARSRSQGRSDRRRHHLRRPAIPGKRGLSCSRRPRGRSA